jgi:1-aminocyclopropane-1-carboxylate deaminase/D-cysteine desulfhydrase-like pyridoxal-dependent ACC family enzyme
MVALTGCTSTADGLLGRFHRFDSTEYAMTVDLVAEARSMTPQCENFAQAVESARNIARKADRLALYVGGRPYNSRTTELTKSLRDLATDTQYRDTMSEFFCRERSKNIIKAAEILMKHTGEKPE